MKHEHETVQPAPVGQVEREVGRPVSEHVDEAVKLAKRMAAVAGKQRADTMAQACFMLLCCATMTAAPESYFEWLDRMEERGA